MDINILVRPVYGRQRAQSTGISELNISYALCVPMGIHIGRVSLYADPPNLDMLRNWSASRLQSLIERSANRSLCRTSVALSHRWILTSSLGLFMNANEHNQLTSPILMSTIPCVCLWVYTRLAIKACTQACRASTCSLSASRPSLIRTPTDRSPCHPCTINGFNQIVTFRTPTSSLGLFMNANEHN
jgi:hypothetical protein